MLGGKAYDRAELREELNERGTRAASPITTTGNNRLAAQSVSTGCAGASSVRSQSQGLQAHRNRYDRLTRNCLASVRLAAALCMGGFNESGTHYFGRFICCAFGEFVVCNMGIAEMAVEG
jgi:hypothetical protein